MIDRTHTGVRCRIRYLTRSVKGDLLPDDMGTIVYEYDDNLGGFQILVDWDKGFSVPVFPEEMEILEETKSGKEGKDNGRNEAA